jgi:hypothetical protein
VPVVILLVAAVILGGIVVVAMGRGGELARDKVEMPGWADLRSWSDVARYRPPPALLGYHAASTEQALMLIARSIAERDGEISWLRGRLAELQPESAPEATAPEATAPEATDPEITPSPEDTATRACVATPESASEEPSAWEGASAQENVSASEIGPEPKGSQSAAAAEPPVQPGYWPQAGTAGDHD